jgi:hypothetical protein
VFKKHGEWHPLKLTGLLPDSHRMVIFVVLLLVVYLSLSLSLLIIGHFTIMLKIKITLEKSNVVDE